MVSLFSMEVWTLLIIGFIIENPLLMSIWLTTNTLFLGLDFFTWTLDMITNGKEFPFKTVVSELCCLCTVLLNRCVRNVFQAELQSDSHHLQLFF